ncbi:MAG: hypothetical protein ACI4UN_06355 [Muribaculaceae bacterium]
MNELKNTFGTRLPYSESAEYMDNLMERCRNKAIAEAQASPKHNVCRVLTPVVAVAAMVAIVVTLTLKLALTPDAEQPQVLCSVESVEKSAPLSEVLASMSDDQIAEVGYYYTTDDIPEY